MSTSPRNEPARPAAVGDREHGPAPVGRRAFLARLGAVAAASCAAAALGACAGLVPVPATYADRRLVVRLADIGDAGGVLVRHPEDARPIYLFRQEGGSWGALLTRCTHRGCQVEPRGRRLVCPCHGSEFDVSGAVLEGPADRPLRAFPARAEGDRVIVDLRGEGDA